MVFPFGKNHQETLWLKQQERSISNPGEGPEKQAVQPGDEVEKGQILVEGMLPVTNDSGEVERTLFVRADADIRLRTTKIYREGVAALSDSAELYRKDAAGLSPAGLEQWIFWPCLR